MAETGVVKSDPLFKGLTRPPTFLGVSFSFVFLNLLIVVLSFINLQSFWIFIIGVTNHLIGYIICFKEPLFLELYLIRAQKCSYASKNKTFHGANSYDMT